MFPHERVQQHVSLLGVTAAHPHQGEKEVQQVEDNDSPDQAV